MELRVLTQAFGGLRPSDRKDCCAQYRLLLVLTCSMSRWPPLSWHCTTAGAADLLAATGQMAARWPSPRPRAEKYMGCMDRGTDRES